MTVSEKMYSSHQRGRHLLAAALAFFMVASHAVGPSSKVITAMSSNHLYPTPEVATFCLGRFLIDFPVGSKISGANYKYDFATIEPPTPMSSEQFEAESQARETLLSSTKHQSEPSLLREAKRPSRGSQVLVFFEEAHVTAGVSIEGRRWAEGMRFLLKTDAAPSKQARAANRMIESIARLRPRADADLPTDPGYCFGGGFIANNEWENEEARVDIAIAGHPDAYMTVWFYPLPANKRDKPLLNRMGGAVGALGNLASAVRVLRKGDRNLGPFKEGDVTIGPFIGQEYLTSVPNSGGMRAHYFQWISQGEGTLQEPHVSIELSTGERDAKGNPQQTTLTDEQALQLWDRVVKSFRLRPTSPAAPTKTSDATPPLVPLGELAATGRARPQTGWWECVELSAPVQGGRRQHFALGERMPPAVLLGEASVWQKLKREQPQHPIATVWKLVDRDETTSRPPVAPVSPAQGGDTT